MRPTLLASVCYEQRFGALCRGQVSPASAAANSLLRQPKLIERDLVLLLEESSGTLRRAFAAFASIERVFEVSVRMDSELAIFALCCLGQPKALATRRCVISDHC